MKIINTKDPVRVNLNELYIRDCFSLNDCHYIVIRKVTSAFTDQVITTVLKLEDFSMKCFTTDNPLVTKINIDHDKSVIHITY